MRYRSITIDDARFLTEVFSVPEYELYFAENDTTEEGWQERIPLYNDKESLIVSDGDKDIGWVMFTAEDDVCSIDIIVLLPEERYRGYGNVIMNDILARNSQIRTLKLDVQQRNTPAVTFYEKLGFHVVAQESQIVAGTPVMYYKMQLDRQDSD